MANIQKELKGQPVEDIKLWVDITVNRAGESDSYLKPTTTAVMMTTKFPKESHPALKRRKLGSNHWDKIHEAIQGQKRDASECPSDYQLCPKSMDGGCCPNDRSCGKSSCYLTTTATASACGIAGYTACGIAEGGGCCPNGYFCATDGCKASPGVSYSQTCGVNSYLCPASLNYGCCQNGMGCGLNNCYSTAVTTFTLVETFTTTSDSQIQTVTSTLVTASTPASPSVAANTSKASAVPKITPTPTAIAKTQASSSSDGSSTNSGLTKPQIGGIIGGAGFILLVLLIAAFFILRRIKKVAAIEEKKEQSRSARTPSQPQYVPYPSPPVSIDPFQVSGSERSRSVRNNSYPYSSEAEGIEAVSPPTFTTPFSPYSPYDPFSPGQRGQIRTPNPARGYQAVPVSDSAYSQASSGRNPSVESTPPHQIAPDYFNIPPHHGPQNLRHGHDAPVSPIRRPSQHGRNWSDASDVSGTSSSPLVELEAGDDGDFKFDLSKAWKVLGLGSWKGKVAKKKMSHNTLSTVNSSGEGTNTLERAIGGRLAGVEEETGSFMEEGEQEAEGNLKESRPRSKESGSRPRSGLSNAELREASMKNFQATKGKGRPREVFITRVSEGSGIGVAPGAGDRQVMGPADGGSKAEEAGYF